MDKQRKTSSPDPYLSVVVVSRNDEHGGDLSQRTHWFVHSLNDQCRRFGLDAELVLVEWNPPADRPSLAASIRWPDPESLAISTRIIRVPLEAHNRVSKGVPLPLFQMMGKNVGLRRCRGAFAVATNIDIIFSDALIRRLAEKELSKGRCYRVDRCDVPHVPGDDVAVPDLPAWCEERVFRIHARDGLYLKKNADEDGRFHRWERPLPIRIVSGLRRVYDGEGAASALTWLASKLAGRLALGRGRQIPHTNACGDFTLMAKSDWEELRGYPEWPMYSWHMDGLLVHLARSHGIVEEAWERLCCVYHMEHGAGWSPEAHDELFRRLWRNGIPFIDDPGLDGWVRDIEKRGRDIHFSGDGWGLGAEDLEEIEPVPSFHGKT